MQDFVATDKAGSGVASSACVSCKGRKQKCDKALPNCSRCERLLLTCRYQKPPSPPSPPSSDSFLDCSMGPMNNRDREETGRKEVLAQALALVAASSRTKPCLPAVSSLVELHDQQFQEMVNEFFKSYHNCIPIVHEESFREHYNKQLLHTSRGLTASILGMCLLTRPFMDEGGEDTLRISLCTVLRRLFWVPTLVERPTMPLIQSGVLLSFYEYGQGMINSAYITICTCSGLAQVCSLNKAQQSSLPGSGFWTPQIECERTWWAILIHERMISLKTGALLRPLHIKPSDEVENVLHRSKLEDRLSIAFYYEARAATFLDQVLNLIHDPDSLSQEGRLLFQTLARSLLLFIESLTQQSLGFCCEAVAIGLSAFMQLHQWRLSNSTSIFSIQDWVESSDTIEAVIKIISDTGRDLGDSGSLFCHSPYSIHVIYQILVTVKHLDQSGRERMSAHIQVLKMMLEHQKGRWKIAGDYLAGLSGD